MIVVGAWGREEGCVHRGAAYAYHYDAVNQWNSCYTLSPSDGGEGHQFGKDVAVVGDVIVVGADCHETAYVFDDMGNGWSERVRLTAPEAESPRKFSKGIGFDGFRAVIGGPELVTPDGLEGAVYVAEFGPLEPRAYWECFGEGWPGTNDVPSFYATKAPVICADIGLEIGNSSGALADAFLFIGFLEICQETALGGKLLVSPFLISQFPVPPNGIRLEGTVPCDCLLEGQAIYLQVLQEDVGASHGVSFTRGVKLVFGY